MTKLSSVNVSIIRKKRSDDEKVPARRTWANSPRWVRRRPVTKSGMQRVQPPHLSRIARTSRRFLPRRGTANDGPPGPGGVCWAVLRRRPLRYETAVSQWRRQWPLLGANPPGVGTA